MPQVLVTGANRGLGLEFVRQYAQAGWSVFACCRDLENASELRELANAGNVLLHKLDVGDFGAIKALADQLRGEPIDLLLNNAGLFGPKIQADRDKRQSFGHVDYTIWDTLLRVNTMAPLHIAECFVEHVAASEQKKIVALTSIMGSIADTSGGLYAYRSSKAALNMVMASLAHELAPRGIAVSVFCPGWVKTAMGGPQASIEPEVSIAGLRERIAEMRPAVPICFRRYNDDELAW